MKNWFYIVFVFVSHIGAAQTTFFVNDNSTAGDLYCSAIGNNSNSGTSPLDPVESLSYILNTIGISDGDVIVIDTGVYFETDANLNLSNNNITINGAGSSLTIFDNNQSSSDANRWATITGENITIFGIYITGYNYGIGDAFAVQITGATNLTLTDVMVNENLPGGGSSAIVVNGGSSVTFNGGGSSCNPGSLTVSGGGMNIEGNGNIVTIDNYNFSNNYKDLQGGAGLYIDGDGTTEVSVTNTLFEGNVTDGSQGGGAIFIMNGAQLTLSACCVNNNEASQASTTNYGGGLMVGEGSDVMVDNCSFANNSATASGNGGAIAINSTTGSNGGTPTVSLSVCSFDNNVADDGNDIFTRGINGGVLTAFQCTWSDNSLTEEIHQDAGTITLENSGTPTITGSVIFTNTTVANLSPTTVCPSVASPCFSILQAELPVELFVFEGKCNDQANELFWQTSSEYNNAFFLLERAGVDGQFEIIEKIPGSLNSSASLTYYYFDENPKLGLNYYRLSQEDVDGRSESFEPITVYNNCQGDELIVNYIVSDNMLYFSSPMEGVTSVSLMNMAGQLVELLVTDPHESLSKLKLKDPPVGGVYLLKIDEGGMIQTGRVLIT